MAFSTKWSSVTLITISQVLSLSLWFSATAIIPSIIQNIPLTDFQSSLLSSSVTIGFIVGTIASSVFGLADKLNAKSFFIFSTFIAGLANYGIIFSDPTNYSIIFLRIITGLAMAGIYPIGIKMVASWSDKDMGFLVGLLVGALTLGSASPHLINVFGGLDWQLTITATTIAAFLSGIFMMFTTLGPNLTRSPHFSKRTILNIWTNKAIRLANIGYFGHMWELYAMWVWIGSFLLAHFQLIIVDDSSLAFKLAGLTAFLVIALGAVGSILGGWLADKIGRTKLTISALMLSGSSALTIGLFFGGNSTFLVFIASIWGITIIADSAQFSSSIVELSEPKWTGTMLTLQTSIGFGITLVSIHLIPYLVSLVGWNYAFIGLAPGAFAGAFAMYKLRQHPNACLLANGKK